MFGGHQVTGGLRHAGMPTSTRRPMSSHPLLCALILACVLLGSWRASAQDSGGETNTLPDATLTAQAEAETETVVEADSAAASVAVTDSASVVSPLIGSVLERARALSVDLRSVERLVQDVEVQRSKIRFSGPELGRCISYTVMGAMWLGAIVAASTAGGIEDGLRNGDIDSDLDDTDGDGDVDQDDVKHTRRVGRVLAATSILPLGLGIFSSVLYHLRLNESRRLGQKLEQLSQRRRSLIDQLGATLDVGASHASLQIRMAL